MTICKLLAGRQVLASLVVLAAGGCVSATTHTLQLAQRSGLRGGVIQGTEFRHQVFTRRGDTRNVLFVFLEGDGVPWTNHGTEASDDPTPHRPLALELAVQTPHSVLYLGRPCYYGMISDPGCTPASWTWARYSSVVVESMAAAVNRFMVDNGYRRVVLIGYSGGGTLAVLMAPNIAYPVAVITIAADLDIDRWARLHRYLPLQGSLNPAARPALDSAIQEWHLVGDRDRNVPEETSRRYFERLAPEHIWHFPEFDHVCCWVQQWPRLLARVEDAISD